MTISTNNYIILSMNSSTNSQISVSASFQESTDRLSLSQESTACVNTLIDTFETFIAFFYNHMISRRMCLVTDDIITSNIRKFVVRSVQNVPTDTHIYTLHDIIEDVDCLEALFIFSRYEYNTTIVERATL